MSDHGSGGGGDEGDTRVQPRTSSGASPPETKIRDSGRPASPPEDEPASPGPSAHESDSPDSVPVRRPPEPDAFLGPVPDIPGFQLTRELGRGGMSVVYAAWQRSLQRPVSLKVLHPELGDREDIVARLRMEATALAGLAHPNVVAIHDRGKVGDHIYLVMEYVDGWSLRAALAVHPEGLPPHPALEIGLQVAWALEYVHEQGVIHRDVKPANVLLSRTGQVKLTDFGLAGIPVPSADLRLTKHDMVMGTADYMAPEQRVNSRSVDHRADLYSLGVTLYETLTGQLPVGAWQPPSHHVEGLDERIDALVLSCLVHDREERVSRAGEVIEVLEAVLADLEERPTATDSALPARPKDPLTPVLEKMDAAQPTPAAALPTPARMRHRELPASRRLEALAFVAAVAVVAVVYLVFLAGGPGPDAPTLERVEAPAASPPAPAPVVAARLHLSGSPGEARARLVALDDDLSDHVVVPGEAVEGLPPGRYRLEVTREGYLPLQEEITLDPGQSVQYRYTLVPEPSKEAGLWVRTDPADAAVSCLDCPEDHPPWTRDGAVSWTNLPAGSYTLEIEAPGHDSRREAVTLEAGQTHELRISLPATPTTPTTAAPPSPAPEESPLTPAGRGLLAVTSKPPGATVLLDGEPVGTTPLRDLPVAPGRYRLQLTMVGHEPAVSDVRIEEGERESLDWALARLTGTLDVESTPSGAEVWIDDRLVGTTPLRDHSQPFGGTTVEVRKEGHLPWRRTVLVQARKRERLVAELQPQ